MPPELNAADERWGAGWLEQLLVLTERTIKMRRLETLSWLTFAQVFLVALLSGCAAESSLLLSGLVSADVPLKPLCDEFFACLLRL